MLVPGLERAARDDVHPDAQEFLKVLKQADLMKKRCTWIEVHQHIQVAVRASLSPGDGAEHGDPMSPPLPGDTEDLRAAAAEPLKCQHIIGHVSSVSPRASTTLGIRRGRPRPVNDMWIAACRLTHGIPLATLNLKDYEDFNQHHGLRILGRG